MAKRNRPNRQFHREAVECLDEQVTGLVTEACFKLIRDNLDASNASKCLDNLCHMIEKEMIADSYDLSPDAKEEISDCQCDGCWSQGYDPTDTAIKTPITKNEIDVFKKLAEPTKYCWAYIYLAWIKNECPSNLRKFVRKNFAK